MSSKKKPEKYPEHVKLEAIHEKSQVCYDFFRFLEEGGYCLAQYPNGSAKLCPARTHIRELLADFFEIDMDKIEEEKLAMIEECRKQHEGRGHAESK